MFGLLLLIRCDEVPAGLPCSCREGAWWGGAGPAPGAPREVSAQVCNLVHEHRLAAGVVLQALRWCRGPPGKLLVSGGSGLDRQNPSLSFPLL